ncbi:MAG: DUF4375 domain-containing protein [Coprobacillus sp.]
MDWKIFLVWILSASMFIFLGYFFTQRMRKNKELRRKAQIAYEERKTRYTYLKPGIFDECPKEDVSAAALFHCMRKEDEDFDHYFEKMNESEKTIYGIYQVSLSLEGQGASLHSFFLSPASRPFVENIVETFERVDAHDIATLMVAAKRFAEIIENNEEDDEEDEELGDFSRYNFSDFTQEFRSLVSTTNLNEKLIRFILEHKEDFYDYDIPQVEEGRDEENEGISE